MEFIRWLIFIKIVLQVVKKFKKIVKRLKKLVIKKKRLKKIVVRKIVKRLHVSNRMNSVVM